MKWVYKKTRFAPDVPGKCLKLKKIFNTGHRKMSGCLVLKKLFFIFIHKHTLYTLYGNRKWKYIVDNY